MSAETTTETSKKSFLTRAMERVAAKENGEGTDEQNATSKKLITKIAIGAGAVVVGTAAVSLVLKRIAAGMEDVAPEDETESTDN
jgi:hypothetical protein